PGAHEGVEEVAAVLGDGGQAASYRAELSVPGARAVAAEIRCRSLIMRMSGSVPLLSTTASRPAPPPKTAGRPATDAIAPGGGGRAPGRAQTAATAGGGPGRSGCPR